MWDRLEVLGLCALPLAAANVQGFVACVGERVRGARIAAGGEARVDAALQDLVELELMAQACRPGFSGRDAWVRFKKKIGVFVKCVHSYLCIK